MGINRSFSALNSANILVFVDDKNPIKAFQKINKKKTASVVFVQNKCDAAKKQPSKKIIKTSCKTLFGIDRLSTAISPLVDE